MPLATIGSHYSFLVLPGGDRIARVARALAANRSKRFPVTAGALLVAVVAPIDVCAGTAHIDDPAARVEARVVSTMEHDVRTERAFRRSA